MLHGNALKINIDLVSDTATKPSQAMRDAIANAEVGDEQKGEDPTVNALCNRVAQILGKEAAVFLPSGTMCNEIALAVHCRPGDEVIMDITGHPLHFESGGPSALAGVMIRPVYGNLGVFDANQVVSAIRPVTRHSPLSALVWVEQTVNLAGGHCWQLNEIREVTAVARQYKLATHLDGARLFNATISTGIGASTFSTCFDSVWIDLTKGLGAPVGAVLAGTATFIEHAKRMKQRWGGAMRQAGIIAAAGLYALDNNLERLADDHITAKVFAEIIAQHPYVQLDPNTVETNIVLFEIDHPTMDAASFAQRLLDEAGVRVGVISPKTLRAVTHLDVPVEKAREAGQAVIKLLTRKG